MDEMRDTEINSKVVLKLKNEIQTKEKRIKTPHDFVVGSKDLIKPQILTEESTQNVANEKPRTAISNQQFQKIIIENCKFSEKQTISLSEEHKIDDETAQVN